MITFAPLKLDEGTCYFLLRWEGPPEDAKILTYMQAEVALNGLADDDLNMEIMKQVLYDVDQSCPIQDMSRQVLLQALSDHLICETLRIAFKSEIPRGTSRPAPPEEEAPAAGAPSESQSSTQTCSADSISIKCGHSGRNFNLKVEKDQTPEVDTIRVISGATTNTADEMEVEVKGSCDQGRSDCPRVKVWGNGV
ncbi:MAG: hypothetical protein QF645_10765, partial [Planctomycetota bacterium]|nr:hypothetical protein [Planctomycetota bacterium]